mgnify:CR=1 FL=1
MNLHANKVTQNGGLLMAYAEHQKAECTFEINPFNRPLELSGIEAWTRLILRLMFMEKGTYPSEPKMGCGITAEMYETIDVLKGTVRNIVESQIRQFLPDLPFYGINVYSEDELIEGGEENVVYYMIAFQKESGAIQTVKVPSRVVHRVIDFDIVF